MIEIPDKDFYNIKEVSQYFQRQTGKSYKSVRRYIERKIEAREIPAKKKLGSIMIERQYVIKMLEGSPI
jgi:hypothetical protein